MASDTIKASNRSVLALSALLVSPATPAVGQAVVIQTAERGAEMAQKLCSGCHAMDGSQSATIQAGLPSLRGIANRDGQTGQRIFDVLINPHPPMPDISLAVGEIQSIILYLDSLRTNPNVQPLIVPREQLKVPIYPRQS